MPVATARGFHSSTRWAPTQGWSEYVVRPSFVAQRNTAPDSGLALAAAAARGDAISMPAAMARAGMFMKVS